MSKAKLLAVFGVVALAALGGWAWASESSGEQEHPTAPQLIKAFEEEWNDEQEAILADGVVTREEFDATTDRVAQCLEAYGAIVTRTIGTGQGGVDELLSEWPPSPESPRDLVIGCYERHQGKLSMVWGEENRPTPEQVAAHAAAMDACLASKGTTLTFRDLEKLPTRDPVAMSAFSSCLSEVPRAGAAGP